MNLKFLSTEELIDKIKALKLRTRDSLTIEDNEVLDECIAKLESMEDHDGNQEHQAEIWVSICHLLIKWLAEDVVNLF